MKFFIRYFFLFSSFFPTLNIYSQEPGKINLALRNTINENKNSSEWVFLLLKGERKAIEKAVVSEGGHIKYAYNDIVAVNLPIVKVKSLVYKADNAIEQIEFHYGNGMILNDKVLINNRISSIHDGIVHGIPEGLTGKGVLLGLIDTGIDFNHPDFKDSTGRTRVKFIWDQTQSVNNHRTPQPYNYGQEWNSQDIDQGICTHEDQPAYYGHGTNVAGTAAGNGMAIGKYKGVAPEADLIIVSSKLDDSNWLSTVVDAVHYIFSKADSLDMPCVINASVGSYNGSHDAKDLSAQLIEHMLAEKRGRAFVCAAGNAGDRFFHLGHNITAEPKFTWFKPYSPSGKVYFRLWADTANFNNASFAFGADKVSPYYSYRGATAFDNIKNRLNSIKADSLFSVDGNFLGIVETWCEQLESRYSMEVQISKADSANYNYRFITRGSGKFDIWSADWLGSSNMVLSSLPNSAEFPDIINYVSPDNEQTIVGSFSCSPNIITVGNYTNRNSYTAYNGNAINIDLTVGEISASSSRGPTRTGLVKPDIAATGNIVICPGKQSVLNQLIINNPDKVVEGGKHGIGGGTSMSSPVVAGIAALYMQLCPQASHMEIKKAVLETAYTDNFTGSVPNNTFGYGKIDGSGVVSRGVIQANIVASDPSVLCQGDSVVLSSDKVFYSYLWNTGDTVNSIVVTDPGSFQVSVSNIQNCKTISPVYHVGFAENPVQPLIWRKENILHTVTANTYQWFLNGIEIGGANSQTFQAKQDGNYSVRVTNYNDCSAHSAILPFVFFTGEAFKVDAFPNPAEGQVEIDIKNNTGEITLISVADVLGQIVLSKSIVNPAYNFRIPIDLSSFPNGIYTIRMSNKENIHTIKIVKAN